MSLGLAVGLYLLAINGLTYAAFAFDKAQARAGARRVPEARLLQLAFFGGSPGALAAQRRLRHKTQKQPFKSGLFAIAGLHSVLAIVALVVNAG